MEEFFPESFRLDLKEERNAFFEHCKGELMKVATSLNSCMSL